MTKDATTGAAVAADALLFEDWFDAIEDGVRARVRGFIETLCWRRNCRRIAASALWPARAEPRRRGAAGDRRPAWPPRARTDRDLRGAAKTRAPRPRL
jgi:hypothetical protein